MKRIKTTRRAAIAIGLLAAVAQWSPSLAADPKPDAAIKTKAIEASVFLENKIKADPALSAYALPTARSGSTRTPPMPPRK